MRDLRIQRHSAGFWKQFPVDTDGWLHLIAVPKYLADLIKWHLMTFVSSAALCIELQYFTGYILSPEESRVAEFEEFAEITPPNPHPGLGSL